MADRRPQDPTQRSRTRNWKKGFSLTLSPTEILHDINLIKSAIAGDSLTSEHGEPAKKRDSTSDSDRTISDEDIKVANILSRIQVVNESKERTAKMRAKRIADINDRNERESKERTAKRIADVNDRNERALKRAMNKEKSDGKKPMQGEGSSKSGSSKKSAAAKGRR